jgi:hypothetical protein
MVDGGWGYPLEADAALDDAGAWRSITNCRIGFSAALRN